MSNTKSDRIFRYGPSATFDPSDDFTDLGVISLYIRYQRYQADFPHRIIYWLCRAIKSVYVNLIPRGY